MLALVVTALAASPMDLVPVATAAVEHVAPRSPRLPGFQVGTEGQPPDANGYYLFEGLWDGTAGGSVHLAGIFVSKYDGDVWDGSTCERLTSKGIRRAQRILRRNLKLVVRVAADNHRPSSCAVER